jgi:EpsI family protein
MFRRSTDFKFTPANCALTVLVVGALLLMVGKPVPGSGLQSQVNIPMNLGAWEGKNVGVEQRAKEILETDQVELREYHLPNQPAVWFSQVSGFGNRAAFHPPELCYVGGHFEVLERSPLTIKVKGQERQVMRLVIGQGNEKFEAWYWFTANDRITSSYYQQQLWLLLEAMKRKPASGTLVRISTVLDGPAANQRLLSFLDSLTGYLTQQANE